MKILCGLFALILIAACSTSQPNEGEKRELSFSNEQFYDEEGNFLPERAKDAIIEMLEYHNYPTFESLRDRIWLMPPISLLKNKNYGNYTRISQLLSKNSKRHVAQRTR